MEKTSIRVLMTQNLKQRIRDYCGREDMTISQMVKECIKEKLDRPIVRVNLTQ